MLLSLLRACVLLCKNRAYSHASFLFAMILLLCSPAHALVQRGVGNLSFEQPIISTVSPCRVYLAQDKVPFWDTNHPPTAEETNGPCNGGTVSSPPLVAPIFEIWRGPRAFGSGNISARSGQQFIELNATQLSEPRQNICLIQGETVRWRFSHNGRNTNPDSLEFLIGTTSVMSAQTTTAGVGTILNCTFGTCNVNSTTSGGRWADYTGEFTYTGVSGVTPMRFRATSGQPTSGNFLDDIQVEIAPLVEFGGAAVSTSENTGIPPAVNVIVVGLVPTGGINLALRVNPSANATVGVDFTINGQSNADFTVFVPAGDYSAGLTVAIPIQLSDDGVAEGTESFSISLQPSPTNAYRILSTTTCGGGAIGESTYEIIDDDIISGRVFNDYGGTDPDSLTVVANAYNGIQNVGELGLAGSSVQLNNCAGTVIATTQTNRDGDYSFTAPLSVLGPVGAEFCITQTNLADYSSVSGTAGYTRATDTIRLTKTTALHYPNNNFGDTRLGLILTTDGQQTTTPSGTVSYPHILRSDSVLDVGVLNTVSTESPTLGWTAVLYRDNNCNGVIDTGESALTSAIGQMLPNQEVCVVQRVNAPANASNGAQHVATLSASYTATVQDSTVLNGSSNSRTDTTIVGTASLDMRKQIRVVASCPSTGADVAAFTERNTAKNGDFLEYEIIYTNRSTRNLSQLTVRDVVPTSTTFQSATCQSTPSGSCTAPVTAGVNGDLAWSLTNIAPAATGSIRFCVRVPPLAAPPIP